MCSECWDEHFRPPTHPRPRSTECCICTRRSGLETLLVCRRWYLEAGHVFYSRNTFAFEDCAIFVDFIHSLPSLWMRSVSRVSILLAALNQNEHGTNSVRQDVFENHWNGRKHRAHVWSHLRRLPSLSYLELDAAFLARSAEVRSMLRLGLRGVRRVSFVQRNHHSTYSVHGVNASDWPEFDKPMLLVDGLAGEVARAIKGQRPRWLKRCGAVETATERESQEQENRRESSDRFDKETREYDCHNCDEWRRLWWGSSNGGNGGGRDSHPAYLPSERHVRHRGDWRQWRPEIGDREDKVDQRAEGRQPQIDHRVEDWEARRYANQLMGREMENRGRLCREHTLNLWTP